MLNRYSAHQDTFMVVGNIRADDPARWQREDWNGSTLYEMLSNPSDFAVIYFELSPEQEDYLIDLINMVSVGEIEEKINWETAKDHLLSWYGGLPTASKIPQNYDEQIYRNVVKLLNYAVENPQHELAASALLWDRLRTSLDAHVPEEAVERFQSFSVRAFRMPELFKTECLEQLATIFQSDGKTESEIMEAIKHWYKSLELPQRQSFYKNQYSNILIDIIRESDQLENLLVEFPERIGIGTYDSWDRSSPGMYIAAVQSAKTSIDGKDFADTQLSLNLDVEKEDPVDVARDRVLGIIKLLGLDSYQIAELLRSLEEKLL